MSSDSESVLKFKRRNLLLDTTAEGSAEFPAMEINEGGWESSAKDRAGGCRMEVKKNRGEYSVEEGADG